jgi:hypothetical protein
VQPEHQARAGDEPCQRHEQPGEFREMRTRLPGEGHRVQRMAGRETVAIERRAGEIDGAVRDEGPLAYEDALEQAVDGNAERAGERHDQCRAHGRRAVEQRQQKDQHVPEDAVAQAAGDLEDAARQCPGGAAVESAAQPVFSSVDARHERHESCRFHMASCPSLCSSGCGAYSLAAARFNQVKEM